MTEYFCNTEGVGQIRIFWGIRKGYDTAHIRCKDITQFVNVADTLYSYAWYTISRNPYDRIYSAYKYLQKGKLIADEMPFLQFLEQIDTDIRSWGVHALPMVHFCDAEDIERYKIKVLRTESLDAEFKAVLESLGLPTRIVKQNVANPEHDFSSSFRYRARYDQTTLEIVNRLYDEDFRVFNYEKIATISDIPLE